MEKIEIKDGQVWSSEMQEKYRRVIGQIDGHIVYCVGADSHRICKEQTFLRWLKQSDAKIANQTSN